MDKVDIINRIGFIRVKAKLTQKALSYAIGMNPSYINRLESKKDFLPSVDVLLKIIDECGSTAEEFFYSDIAAYEKDKQLAEKIKALPNEVKELIFNYDSELMNIFVRLNQKAVKIDK
ncbi:MAG: helix-turn-helix transcriptional regulator [Clostridiales bacterium]|nr:helix-turn-helix transcriptional regulator [Clostridiales bacterium]